MMAQLSDLPIGEGERIERTKARRRLLIVGSLFVAGMFSGGYIGYALSTSDFDLTEPWPPAAALALAAVYLVAMTLGSWLLSKNIDEIERSVHSRAGAFAGAVYLFVYPLWFFLWKGGFLPEPIHWILFILFWVSLLVGTLWYRNR